MSSTTTKSPEEYALMAHNRIIEKIKNAPKDSPFAKANQDLLTKAFNTDLIFSTDVILAGFVEWSITVIITENINNFTLEMEDTGTGFAFEACKATVYGAYLADSTQMTQNECQFSCVTADIEGGICALSLVNAATGKVWASLVGPALGVGAGAVNGKAKIVRV